MNIIGKLKFIWSYFVRGEHRLSPIPAPPDFEYPQPGERLMDFLVGMYRGHGAIASRVGNWVCVDGGSLFTRAAHFDHRQHPGGYILQADFVTLAAGGHHIVESFGGIGTDFTTALEDACKSFQDATFHALFVTLLGHPCEHVERERWLVAERPRIMTFGWLRMRGPFPIEDWPPMFERFRKHMEALPLTSGLHWGRYYYGHLPSSEPVTEVLIDNEPHKELQSELANSSWPASDEFYSGRLFFVIQDA